MLVENFTKKQESILDSAASWEMRELTFVRSCRIIRITDIIRTNICPDSLIIMISYLYNFIIMVTAFWERKLGTKICIPSTFSLENLENPGITGDRRARK